MLFLKVLRIWKNEDINLDKVFKATVSLLTCSLLCWWRGEMLDASFCSTSSGTF